MVFIHHFFRSFSFSLTPPLRLFVVFFQHSSGPQGSRLFPWSCFSALFPHARPLLLPFWDLCFPTRPWGDRRVHSPRWSLRFFARRPVAFLPTSVPIALLDLTYRSFHWSPSGPVSPVSSAGIPHTSFSEFRRPFFSPLSGGVGHVSRTTVSKFDLYPPLRFILPVGGLYSL